MADLTTKTTPKIVPIDLASIDIIANAYHARELYQRVMDHMEYYYGTEAHSIVFEITEIVPYEYEYAEKCIDKEGQVLNALKLRYTEFLDDAKLNYINLADKHSDAYDYDADKDIFSNKDFLVVSEEWYTDELFLALQDIGLDEDIPVIRYTKDDPSINIFYVKGEAYLLNDVKISVDSNVENNVDNISNVNVTE